MQSRQRGITNVDIYKKKDIVTISILKEWIWKVAFVHKIGRADSVILPLYYLICFCFRFLATVQKWLNNN